MQRVAPGFVQQPPNGTAESAIITSPSRQPSLLLLSDDDALSSLVGSTVEAPWQIARRSGIAGGADLFDRNLRLVVLDDSAVPEDHRGWLLAQIRKYFPPPRLMYIAGAHDDETEKRARTGGADYYMAKPIDHPRLVNVLGSFLKIYK